MAEFRYVVDIQAPPERIWPVLLDVERWPEWTSSVTSAKRLDLGPLTLGSRTEIHQPRLSPAVWCVTSLDEQRRSFAWTTYSLGIKVVAYHEVEEADTGSRVILDLQYSGLLGAIMSRMLRKLNWDYIEREGNGLKRHCETAVSLPVSAR
jgi:uncharacterized membrane protein